MSVSPLSPLSTLERRVAATAGVTSGLALFVAVAAVNPPRSVSDAQVLAYWQDPGHRMGDVTSTFALLICGLAFVVFTQVLCHRQEPGPVVGVLLTCGGLFAALTFVTGAMGALTRGAVVDGEPLPGAEVTRTLLQLRYAAMGAFAMPCAAMVIACVSLLAFRRSLLPRWTGWTGVACSLLIVLAVAAYRGQLAIPALLVWLVCVAISLLRAGSSVTDTYRLEHVAAGRS